MKRTWWCAIDNFAGLTRSSLLALLSGWASRSVGSNTALSSLFAVLSWCTSWALWAGQTFGSGWAGGAGRSCNFEVV